MTHPKTWQFGYNNFTDHELQELNDASIDPQTTDRDWTPPKPKPEFYPGGNLSDDDLVKQIKKLNHQQQPTYWWRQQYAMRMCEAQCARRAAECGQAEGNTEGPFRKPTVSDSTATIWGVLIVVALFFLWLMFH